MARKPISAIVERKLYAESMGRCMNPACRDELFKKKGDVIEKAHIDPYCKTADNSFENLVVLCPTCHTDFDKNNAFSPEEVLEWKRIRRQELETLFSKKYPTFQELKQVVVPLLSENKQIYESYYLAGKHDLWDLFERKILANNRQLKMLFEANITLFQQHSVNAYSNMALINQFLLHVSEFEMTRGDDVKIRHVLFPEEVNSIFGIAPVQDSLYPSTESLEALISSLESQNKFVKICLGCEKPYIDMLDDSGIHQVFLDDTPQIRQLYHNYNSFRTPKVRLDSLNFALKYLKSRNLSFSFLKNTNLREITVNDKKVIFVYEYCLSESELLRMCPEEGSVVVNLHNWNEGVNISPEAIRTAEQMGVKLLTMGEYYVFINKLRKEST